MSIAPVGAGEMPVRLLKLAVIYLVCGMSLGLYMGTVQDFLLRSVHAHINLMGWASLGLAALVFHIFPSLAQTRLSRIWFWGYNLALPVGLVGLALELSGHRWAGPLLGIGMTMVWAMGVLFAVNVLWGLRRAPADAQRAVPAE
jgi:hypothetical protein